MTAGAWTGRGGAGGRGSRLLLRGLREQRLHLRIRRDWRRSLAAPGRPSLQPGRYVRHRDPVGPGHAQHLAVADERPVQQLALPAGVDEGEAGDAEDEERGRRGEGQGRLSGGRGQGRRHAQPDHADRQGQCAPPRQRTAPLQHPTAFAQQRGHRGVVRVVHAAARTDRAHRLQRPPVGGQRRPAHRKKSRPVPRTPRPRHSSNPVSVSDRSAASKDHGTAVPSLRERIVQASWAPREERPGKGRMSTGDGFAPAQVADLPRPRCNWETCTSSCR